MPNHVKNKITGSAGLIDRLIGADSKGKPIVDFNRIIQRPAAVVNECLGMHVKSAAEIALGLIDFRSTGDAYASAKAGDYGAAASVLHVSNCTRQLLEGPHPKDFNDQDWKAFLAYLTAYRECGGLMDWYDWNIAMWGTKWNAYDFERPSETTVLFETAWSAPHKVIERLSEQAKEQFRHEWADEDTGANTGFREYGPTGEFVHRDLSGREAYEMSFALGHADRNDFVLVGDKYEWKEQDE